MANFPFFRLPYNNYKYYNPYFVPRNSANFYNNTIYEENKKEENLKNEPKFENNVQANNKRSSRYKSFGPINFKNPLLEDFDLEEPVLEILGLKLYLDDIIILGLLFFLYNEGVKDDLLFLSLILLLLS